MKLRSIFDVMTFNAGRTKLGHFGPFWLGFERLREWEFKFKAPIRSGMKDYYFGVLISAFSWSVWIYIPKLVVKAYLPKRFRPIPKGIIRYQIPKGGRK